MRHFAKSTQYSPRVLPYHFHCFISNQLHIISNKKVIFCENYNLGLSQFTLHIREQLILNTFYINQILWSLRLHERHIYHSYTTLVGKQHIYVIISSAYPYLNITTLNITLWRKVLVIFSKHCMIQDNGKSPIQLVKRQTRV